MSSSSTVTVIFYCRHHLPLLRVNASAAVTFHSFGLPSTSMSRNLSPIVFHYCYLFYFFVRQLLLPSSSTSWDFLCCQCFPLLPSSSTATIVFHCCCHLLPSCDFLYCRRLPLSPSSSTATIVFHCYCHLLPSFDYLYCRRLPLSPSTATIVFHCCCTCCHRVTSFSVVVFYCHRHRLLPPSSSTVAVTCCHRVTSFTVVVFYCHHRLPLLL
ncbi:hypothetical protein CDAR_550631 [Caerostris darwini]|uniref:Uncharacterized protein n=1 Tax=Caerostris darwini TaxID=1538125 RepID=A0AAV4NQ32_9ARAC|nr:hypothetical protein CDAR_550631 [Caerostris darwini]